MPSRDAALDALNNRLAAARDDPGLLLTDDALRDAVELAAATDTTTDLSAAQTLGWFHWNRCLSLHDRDGHRDRTAAIRYFVLVYEASPGSVPTPIQQAIRDFQQDNLMANVDPAESNDQAARLLSVYRSSGEPSALTKAIALFRQAVAATADDHRNHGAYLSNLGNALRALFERTGDTEAIEEAIEVGRAAVAVTADGDPNRGAYLTSLGSSLQRLSERTGDLEALTEAIEVGRAAVAATPDGDPNRAIDLISLGGALQRLSERTGDLEALTEAIEVGRAAVAAVPDGDPNRATCLNILGDALQTLFELHGDVQALAEAVQVKRDAVAATPDGHPNRGWYLESLGRALQMLSGQTGDMEALTEAIEVGRAAVAAVPDGDPNRATCLNILGGTLQTLSARTGDLEALAEAIEVGRAAVAAVPDGHPYRPMYLGNLGVALRTLSERTGDLEALAEAIEVSRAAVAATPDGHPDRSTYMVNLGHALQRMFERNGDMEALAEAVQVKRDAVAATPDGHPSRSSYLDSLGNALQRLSGQTGDMEALAEAIEVSRAAVAATPDDHPDCGLYLSNLGNALQTLSKRTGNVEALSEAIEVGRAAVAATPDDHPNRSAYLTNLGNALQDLSRRAGNVEALVAEAIKVGRAAVAATPDSHPGRSALLNNLGGALQMMFERNGDMEVLAEAIEVSRAAVAAAPDDDPNRAIYLANLGDALHGLFERTGDEEVLAEAVARFRAAGGSAVAAPPARIRGWRQAAVALTTGLVGDGSLDALAAAEAAAGLLPQLTPRWLARADRERQLGEIGSLAGVVAAAAIAAGRPERAVELLEQTRGVLVADTVNARSSDLTSLQETAPELAAAFEGLRARMDALDQPSAIPGGGLAAPGTGQDLERARREARDLADARREAQAAWDQLITRIRGLDGFAGFLAAPSIGKLAVQAQDGPIVFVSTSPTRCDALILTHDLHAPVRLISLSALTETAAIDQANRLLEARQNATDPLKEPTSRMAAQAQILEILAWIWDTITGPVLTALGHTTTPGGEEPWPRVWWSPVGVLSYLPVHAAGHHSDLTASDPALKANPRTVLNRVISSYTTTVRGLAYARTHHPDTGTDNGTAVIVAVPDAPGTHPLSGVTAGTTALLRYLPEALVLADPTRDSVLAALPGHPVAHFACHGYADWTTPANSRLILRDHQTAPLTVADVSALHLTGGLAYLSACDTTVTSQRHVDEAVHITGAFHLAGYQHVIGTLWSISSAAAKDISDAFYEALTSDGKTSPQTSHSAQALHQAIRRLRAGYPQTPTLWAAHTHTGP